MSRKSCVPERYIHNLGTSRCHSSRYSNSSLHLVTYLYPFFIDAVPAPLVNITGVPSLPLYTGTTLLLICTLELHDMVDSPVRMDAIWRRGGDVLSHNDRTNISAISMIQPSVYQTTLSISSLSNTIDSGVYSCQSVSMSTNYVFYADTSRKVSLRIAGKKGHCHIQ